MKPANPGDLGLRELKKQLTRHSIANAALRLALDRGVPAVTLEDIAHEAFVSPRTVSNYFACKEEAIIAAGTEDWGSFVSTLGNRPHDEAPLESLRELFIEYVQTRKKGDLRLIVKKLELGREYSSLRPFQTAQYDELEEALRNAVSERTGLDLAESMYPWLIASAGITAMRAATRRWASSGPGADADRLAAFVHEAFDQIAAGLPVPPTQAAREIPAR